MHVEQVQNIQMGQVFLYGNPLRAYIRGERTHGDTRVPCASLYPIKTDHLRIARAAESVPLMLALGTPVVVCALIPPSE